MNRIYRNYLPLWIALILSGCIADAPHDNPLDPRSPGYTGTGVVSGHVSVKNRPDLPVSGALVSASDGAAATFSDSSGNFSFPGFPIGNTLLVTSKPGFVPESASVSLAAGQRNTIQVPLNAVPTVANAKVTTSRIAVWFPSTQYSASFSATVADLNGATDIDSVWVAIGSQNFSMIYSITNRDFELTIHPDTLPGNNLQVLVGQPLTILARDFGNGVGTSSPFYVSRIIDLEPGPLHPTSVPATDTVSSPFQFSWTETNASFVFTYSIVLARVDNASNETVVWSKSLILPNLVSYPYPQGGSAPVLTPGNYSWILSMIDEYGNSSTSKEYAFVVR
ncbi:MAG TPA: carboxypeptidase-like regulatory domain-containing protein [Bacteroidota bacterium]